MREKRQRTWPTVEDCPFVSIGRKKFNGGGDRRQENGERLREREKTSEYERTKDREEEKGEAERTQK